MDLVQRPYHNTILELETLLADNTHQCSEHLTLSYSLAIPFANLPPSVLGQAGVVAKLVLSLS